MATFKKCEKLCSLKAIECLYEKGESFMCYPFSVRWMMHSDSGNIPPVQVVFGARKKNFKKAVHRNRIKRLLRETYRNQKEEFYNYLNQRQIKIYLSVVFIGSKIGDYGFFDHKIREIIQKISSQIELQDESTQIGK